ncbi:hypothetical protein MBLNU13_g06979t2 [Cladosporium sp. NU13]
MSVFYRLPVELLTTIAQCVSEEKNWFEEGKALRITHPHFANLDHLNSQFFHNVNFHATPEGIDRLKSHLLTALKSFVRKITFLPSDYSTGMTFFHFRRIVIKQCAFYRPADYGLIDHSTQCGAESIEYHKQAQAAQALLTDGSLRVWTNAIRQFSNVKTFEYGKHKEQGFRYHPHDEEDYDLYDDEPQPYHPSSVCALNAIRTQAGLIEPISACIRNAGVHPEKLILSSALTFFEPEYPIPPNLQSHLSGLRSLEWRARLFEDGTDHPTSAEELYRFLEALLHQCYPSLQMLRVNMWSAGEHGIGGDVSPVWPPKQIKHLPLPHLRHLDLKGGVNPRNLALWISSLPRLETLTVELGLDAADGGLWNWRSALDAIRNHPSLLQVRLQLASEWLLEKSRLVVAVHIFTRNSPRTKREVRMIAGKTSLTLRKKGIVCVDGLKVGSVSGIRDSTPSSQ